MRPLLQPTEARQHTERERLTDSFPQSEFIIQRLVIGKHHNRREPFVRPSLDASAKTVNELPPPLALPLPRRELPLAAGAVSHVHRSDPLTVQYRRTLFVEPLPLSHRRNETSNRKHTHLLVTARIEVRSEDGHRKRILISPKQHGLTNVAQQAVTANHATRPDFCTIRREAAQLVTLGVTLDSFLVLFCAKPRGTLNGPSRVLRHTMRPVYGDSRHCGVLS